MNDFKAVATSQVFIGNLEIPYELSDGSHHFIHNGREFRIGLPKLDVMDDCQLVAESRRYAEISSYNPSIGPSSAWFNVLRLFVEAKVEEKLLAPVGLFKVPANAPQLFTEQQRHRNNALIQCYAEEMWAAFLHWSQVAKWVSRQWLLGRQDADQKSGNPGVSFARIENADTGQPFWIAGARIVLLGRAKLTAATWADIQTALTSQAVPPTWIAFLNEAAERFHLEDLNGCIASCAIASETAARAAYFAAAGSPTNSAVIDLMQRASVSAVVDSWKALTGEAKTPPGANEVLKLAGVRNRLVHSGDINAIDRTTVARLLKGTQDFVIHADDWYHQKSKLVNFGISASLP